jgi:hypothetical protein
MMKAIFVAISKRRRKKQRNTITLLTHIHNVLEKNFLRSSAVFLSLFQQRCDAPKASLHFIVQKHPPF